MNGEGAIGSVVSDVTEHLKCLPTIYRSLFHVRKLKETCGFLLLPRKNMII